MNREIFVLLLVFSLPASGALGISIRNAGASSSAPFELSYEDTESPLTIVLQMANESETSASVLSWQLVGLELRALAEAQGNLLFDAAVAPQDSLFGHPGEPLSSLSTPSERIELAFDADMENGDPQQLGAHTVRNFLALTLHAIPETVGQFQLLIPEVTDPEEDFSSWLDADEFVPREFENAAPSEFEGFILLGTINVGSSLVFGPGDYNTDGNVNGQDYDRWKAEFGSSVGSPGASADGNQNLIVDAADYVVWREHAATQSAVARATMAVPEPGGLALTVMGFTIVRGFVRRFKAHIPPRSRCNI